MTDLEFRALLSGYMCLDPTPLSPEEDKAFGDLIDREAKERGYKSWVVAYHEHMNKNEVLV